MKLLDTPPTRQGQKLDKLFVNFSSQVFECGVLKPLENDRGVRSDHAVVYAAAKLKKVQSIKWITYTYKKYSVQAEERFGSWIAEHDWESVFRGKTSTEMAKAFDSTCAWAINDFFPDVHVKLKSM